MRVQTITVIVPDHVQFEPGDYAGLRDVSAGHTYWCSVQTRSRPDNLPTADHPNTPRPVYFAVPDA